MSLQLPTPDPQPPRHRLNAWRYTIPASACSSPDAPRSFVIRELTLSDRRRAEDLAHGNAQELGRELIFASVLSFGDTPADGNYEGLVAWYGQIGPRAQLLLDRAFLRHNTPSEDDQAMFLSSMVPV